MLTALGCPGTPDPRNSSVDKFLSRGISEPKKPELRLTIPVQPRNSSVPQVGGSQVSKVGEHLKLLPRWPNYRVPKKGSFGKGGLFRKGHVLEILENLEILEILESLQTVENKGESDQFLEILEKFEILENLEIPQ